MADTTTRDESGVPIDGERRSWLTRFSKLALVAGIGGGYGGFAWIAARFLYPARGQRKGWMYVSEMDRMSVGETLLFEGPGGETVNITRRSRDGRAEDFLALSSTCPHLGCQVHWEGHNARYFCPCHNGVFDPSGKGVSGPPGDAGLDLPRYPLKVEGGMLFIELPTESLTAAKRKGRGRVVESIPGVHAAGHDPCLAGRGCPDDTTRLG